MMENKKKDQEGFVNIPEKDLLSLVAAKLKNRTLFPERLEEAREYLKKAKLVKK